MAIATKRLPDTLTSPETGVTLTRGVRPFTVRYKGHERTIQLAGYYPEGDDNDDGVLVGDDMKPADEALRELKELVDGLPAPATIKRLRTRLKLTQREAGLLFKVGENAFDKYERGLIQPSGPTVQLMTLLSRHPELINELRSIP